MGAASKETKKKNGPKKITGKKGKTKKPKSKDSSAKKKRKRSEEESKDLVKEEPPASKKPKTKKKKEKSSGDIGVAVRRSPRLHPEATPDSGMQAMDLQQVLAIHAFENEYLYNFTNQSNKDDGKDKHGNPPISDYNISKRSQELLLKRGITHLFPIQAQTFDMIYEKTDVLGRARTGTGKTLAFTLPIVERLAKSTKYGRAPRVVVLAPVRELANQVSMEFKNLEKLTTLVVYGGAPYGPQISQMNKGVDVVVGTCGRVKDHLEKGNLKFSDVEVVILDETDEMLNMGFAEDVEAILNYIPTERKSEVQTLLFSATVPNWVKKVSDKYFRSNKKVVDLVGDSKQKASTDVEHLLISCHWNERNAVINDIIQAYGGTDGPEGRVICFTETKKDANEMVMSGDIKFECQPLHGDIPQKQRETTIAGFKRGTFRVLIATDVAARGIDISGVQLVIQIEPPQSYETYVHRSGRTGRANTKGVSVLFYTAKQRWYVKNIERNAQIKFKRVGPPSTKSLIKASIGKLEKKLESVSDEVVPLFSDEAKRLLEEMDTVDILARALGILTSSKGFITVYVKGKQSIRSMTYVWNIIRRHIFDQPDDKVRAMKLTKDRYGAVFEVPSKYEKQVLAAAEKAGPYVEGERRRKRQRGEGKRKRGWQRKGTRASLIVIIRSKSYVMTHTRMDVCLPHHAVMMLLRCNNR
eukprot:jgi/Bigna1/137216/aug1.38_g11924